LNELEKHALYLAKISTKHNNMLRFQLNSIFKARGIQRPHTFLVKAGIASQTASRILNNDTHVFRLKHVEIICEKLNCTPNDLLVWTPKNDNPLSETHELNKLKSHLANTGNQLQSMLKTMPLEQLNEIAALINEKKGTSRGGLNPPTLNP
jgi:DNA-binding Xre family transcriptional regulator